MALAFVPGLGEPVEGRHRWLLRGPFKFQPSEFAKIALLVYLAGALAQRARAREKGHAVSAWPMVVLTLVVLGLLLAQPNLATAGILTLTVLALVFLSGERPRTVAGLLLLAGALLYFGACKYPEIRNRIAPIFAGDGITADPQGTGYQSTESLLAISSGGIAGQGIGAGSGKLGPVPFSHTDFIFSVIGQETGLLGSLTVIGAFVTLGVWGLLISRRLVDPYRAFLVSGLSLLIALQALANVAIALAFLAPMGLPLPFISFGGSSLIGSLAAVGIITNAASRRAPALG